MALTPLISFETGSPDYASKARCLEFIALAMKYPDIRCLHVAKLEPKLDKEGNPVICKKTGQHKVKYKIVSAIN